MREPFGISTRPRPTLSKTSDTTRASICPGRWLATARVITAGIIVPSATKR